MMDQMHLMRNVGGADLGDRIADADEHDAGGEAVGIIGGAPGGGVAAIGTAGDADLLRIDETGQTRPLAFVRLSRTPAAHERIDGGNEVLELAAGSFSLPHHGKLNAA